MYKERVVTPQHGLEPHGVKSGNGATQADHNGRHGRNVAACVIRWLRNKMYKEYKMYNKYKMYDSYKMYDKIKMIMKKNA
jgi:hypothetical protein